MARICLLASLGLAGCQSGATTQQCALIHVTDLALTQRASAFYTTAIVNGHDVTLQFDTGASENLLTDEAARRLGMSVSISGRNFVQGIGGGRQSGEARSKDVRLGEAHGEDLTFATVPANSFRDSDGLLGMEFMSDFDMDLDFWGGRVGLYKPLKACGAPVTAMIGQLYAVDLATPPTADGEAKDLSPAVYVTINGQRLRALIDTGSFHTTIFRDSARRAGLGDVAAQDEGSMTGMGARAVHADLRFNKAMTIGDLTVSNMPIVVVDQRHPENLDMLLGFDFVTRGASMDFTVVRDVDYAVPATSIPGRATMRPMQAKPAGMGLELQVWGGTPQPGCKGDSPCQVEGQSPR